MDETNVIPLVQPEQFHDALTEVLRDGAQRLLAAAIEAEVEAHLAAYKDMKLPDGRQRIVKHGLQREREVQTGIGAVKVRVPRTRDRDTSGEEKIRFESEILPKYLRRTKCLEGLIPWLYLQGVSSGNFQEALSSLFAWAGCAQSVAGHDPASHQGVGRRAGRMAGPRSIGPSLRLLLGRRHLFQGAL